MNRKETVQQEDEKKLFTNLEALHATLGAAFSKQFDRSLPFSDEVFDRWERAKSLGWGTGSSIYDSAYVFGETQVGVNTWIGPFTIIDGSGKLSIGDSCTISAGVHIYTHNNVKQTLSGGNLPIERAPVKIGANTYIAPQSILTMGITVGKHVLIAANSFVNRDVPDFAIMAGNPAKQIGIVVLKGDEIQFDYTDF